MGRRRSLRESGPADLQRGYVQEKGACAGRFGVSCDASLQVNAAPEGVCVVVAPGPHGKMEGTVAVTQGTFLNVQVEIEREEGQSQDPEVGSLKWGRVLVDHSAVQGRTGERQAEKSSCHFGGWTWELKENKDWVWYT